MREYGTGAEILADLGVKKMILMTNNPLKIKGLDGFGLEVVGRISKYKDEKELDDVIEQHLLNWEREYDITPDA